MNIHEGARLKVGDIVWSDPTKCFCAGIRRPDDPTFEIVRPMDANGFTTVRSTLLGIEVEAHVSELEIRTGSMLS